jgi:hypothetical protein
LHSGSAGNTVKYHGVQGNGKMNSNEFKSTWQMVLAYVCAALVIAAGTGACLLRGFFFTEEAYPFMTLWFGICAVVLTLKLVSGRDRGDRNRVKRLDYPWTTWIVPAVPFVILFLYGIHWLRGPLSAQGTLDEFLRWALYGSFVLIAYSASGNKGAARLLVIGWHGLGLALCLSGLLSLGAGWAIPYAVAYSSAPGVSVTGARLAGLLQYPNTFGAVMGVFLLERLFAVAGGYVSTGKAAKHISSDLAGRESVRGVSLDLAKLESQSGAQLNSGLEASNEAGNQHNLEASNEAERQRTIAGTLLRQLPLFPYAAALLLSESRGAWLAAAIACAAVLALKRQLFAPLLLAGAAPVAAAALFYRQLAAAGLAVEPLPGLLLLAGCWAGALLAGLWLMRRSRSAAQGGPRQLLAAAGWTAAGTAVLTYISARITGPSSTVAARGLFYRDALRLAGEAPWLGRGGETWRNMYHAIQSRPYVGSQVHNGYLDLLLNLGWIGVGVILLLLLAVGCSVKPKPHLLAPFLVLVLHSAADFDWSYGLVWLLLFWLPAIALSSREERVISQRPRSYSLARKSSGRVLEGAVCSLLIIMCVISFRADRGASLYRAALYAPEPVEKASLLKQSITWNPFNPETVVELSRLLSGGQREALLQAGLWHSPQHAGLNWEMAQLYMNKNQPEAALYWIHRSLQADIYNYAKWTAVVEGVWELGRNKLRAGELGEAVRSAEAGLELFHQYTWLVQNSQRKGEAHNDRHFQMTGQAEAAGRNLIWLVQREHYVARREILPE